MDTYSLLCPIRDGLYPRDNYKALRVAEPAKLFERNVDRAGRDVSSKELPPLESSLAHFSTYDVFGQQYKSYCGDEQAGSKMICPLNKRKMFAS